MWREQLCRHARGSFKNRDAILGRATEFQYKKQRFLNARQQIFSPPSLILVNNSLFFSFFFINSKIA